MKLELIEGRWYFVAKCATCQKLEIVAYSPSAPGSRFSKYEANYDWTCECGTANFRGKDQIKRLQYSDGVFQ